MPAELENEKAIVKQCQKGDMHAFKVIYAYYGKSLYRVALRMLSVREDAEDAVQLTFMKLYKSIGQSSPVTVNQCQKNVSIESSYKEIRINGVAGKLDIEGDSSPVSFADIGKDVRVRSSYREIKGERIGGNLIISGSSCPVYIDSVGGNLGITNSYKYVVIKRTAGSILVDGESSPVEISDVLRLPRDGYIKIFTTYKPVKVYLPEESNILVSLDSRYGEVHSDFQVYLNENKRNIESVGKEGSTFVQIETSGDITLRRK